MLGFDVVLLLTGMLSLGPQAGAGALRMLSPSPEAGAGAVAPHSSGLGVDPGGLEGLQHKARAGGSLWES